MTTLDNKPKTQIKEHTATEAPKRKRVKLRDASSGKGKLYLNPNILPGFRLYWAGVSDENPYRLSHLREIGWDPLTESQKKTVLDSIPDGLVGETQTTHGSYITKQSGRVTHYLMCIPLDIADELAEEKVEMMRERDVRREQEVSTNLSYESHSTHGNGTKVKTWGND